MGGFHLDRMVVLMEQGQTNVAAVCDVDEKRLAAAHKKAGEKSKAYRDYRYVLERKDLDAVVIATPDHWHAIQTIAACDAGKDVYIEKPLSITIHEGRRMVEAARRNQRVTQVGTHRRSSKMYTGLAELTQKGTIGKITVGRAYRLSNMYPNGIGKAQPSEPPAGLNWDLWLGPRPERPFQASIAPYKFRWWDLYSTQVANWGVHYLDAIRWLTNDLAPSSVCAMGGRFALDDDRTIPDTLEVTFEFSSGRLAIFGQYEASGNSALRRGELELRGTQGTLYVDDRGYEIVPERGGQFQEPKPRMKPVQQSMSEGEGDMTVAHARNFLDCMRSRKPCLSASSRSRSMSPLKS
jgi:predicted dehydrogenase